MLNNEKQKSHPFVIVRAEDSLVFCGHILSRNGRNVTLNNARRIRYYPGEVTLDALAMHGITNPQYCGLDAAIDSLCVLSATEIILVTEHAKQSLESAEEYKPCLPTIYPKVQYKFIGNKYIFYICVMMIAVNLITLINNWI